jgi:2-desacetyl-2-hydroxyethyl bacteriochlorophyllide A dehydrogenase
MRAAVFHGAGRPLVVETLDDPTPGELQVVVKVGRCGVCGTDLHMTEEHDGKTLMPVGAVPGHEFAGEVVALGAGVEDVKLGDHVAVMPFIGCGRCGPCLGGTPSRCRQSKGVGMGGVPGGYAEYALAGALSCVPLPKSVGMDAGGLVEPMAVSLHGVRMAALKPGDKVLVIGAGPIGLAAIYWAKRAGATVVATASSNRREELARTFGADGFVTPAPDLKLARQVREALGGQPDVVFECVGLPGLIANSIDCVRYGGLVVVLGYCVTADTFMPAVAVAKEVRLQFAVLYDRREFEISAEVFETAGVDPRAMITDVVSLHAAPAAFEALRNRNHQCKVHIAPWLDR